MFSSSYVWVAPKLFACNRYYAEVITFHVDRLDKTLPNDVYRDMISYQNIRERM